MAKSEGMIGLRSRLAHSVQQMSLNFKLGVPLTVVSLLTALALGLTLGFSASTQIDNEFTNHAQALGGYVTDSIASALTNRTPAGEQDRATLQNFVQGLLTSDKTLESMRVFQRVQGRDSLYVNTGSQQEDMPTAHDLQLVASGTPVQKHSSLGGVPTLESLTPIRINGAVWGAVEIDYSLASRTAAIDRIWQETVAVTALGLVAELALFWLMLHLLVLRRLQRIAKVVQGVAGHDLDQPLLEQGGVPGRDELAIVGCRFDEMIESRRRRALQDQLLFNLGLQAAQAGDLSTLLAEIGLAVQCLMPSAVLVAEELVGDESNRYVRAFASSDPDLGAQPQTRLSNSAVINYIVTSGEDIFYEAGNGEDRFDVSAIAALGVCCGLGVIIPGAGRPFGVLAAYSREPHLFEANDLCFLRSIATLIGAAAARMQADRDRLAGEDRVQTAFLASPAGIVFINNRDGNILDANPAFCESLGYDVGELRKLSVLDIVHPDDLDWAASQIASAAGGVDGIDTSPGEARFEQRFATKNGDTVWMQLCATLVRDSAGAPSHFQSTCIDITERKAAEATLQGTLSLLRRTGEDRQRLMTSLVRAQQEQSKDASLLHDHVTQVLVASALELERLAGVVADPEDAQRIELTRAAVEGAVRELREVTDRRKGPRRGLPAVNLKAIA